MRTKNANPAHHPIIKKKRKKPRPKTPRIICNIIPPSEKNKQFYLGRICAGSVFNDNLPTSWTNAKANFSENQLVSLFLDTAEVLIEVLPGNVLIKEIIISRVFAIEITFSDCSVFLDLYFSELPLPKFTQKVGFCIQAVLTLLLDAPTAKETDNDGTDLTSDHAITKLYKSIKEIRAETNLESKDVQDIRLKPKLRPYQADAVQWMLKKEKEPKQQNENLHPLYCPIKLKSGIEIYYDKYSGYVDITKPEVATSTRGGILADEMGLGKTVEVLACILKNPKPDKEEKKIDLDKSPTIDLAPKKRKIEEVQQAPLVDQCKKIKVPDDWVKTSKKSQTFVALQAWYESVLTPSKPPDKKENPVQCICGSFTEKGTVTCTECSKIQHAQCLGYKPKFGPYLCAQCWQNQPLIESKATLIVTPNSLRTQWCKEISKHISGDFKVLQYGGASIKPIYPTALTKYDVVITTYSVLQAEMKLTENEKPLSLRYQRRYSAPGSPITRVKWWRLCLDEAQIVEAPTTIVSAMAQKLEAHFRWAVTGTPIVKDISDLHGLIDYLQMEPYNDKFTWEKLLFEPYVRGQTEPMLRFLSQILWRSTKDEVIDQINIPKQTVKEHWLDFSGIENYFYRLEHKSSSTEFSNKARLYHVGKLLSSFDKSSLKSLLAPLLSLRQVCTYPDTCNTKCLATRKSVTSMKDLFEALINKNTTESEEFLRFVLSSHNGLAGIYLLMGLPQEAIDEYRKALQLYTRFTEEEKSVKILVDKLPVIHALHNLADILEVHPPQSKTLRDDNLRRDCADLEQKYMEKFLNQSMTALQDALMMTASVTKQQDSFILEPGKWYKDLLEWIYINELHEDMYSKICNFLLVANVPETIKYRMTPILLYEISKWDVDIGELRDEAIEAVNDLYVHCPEDEFKIIISQEIVQKATDCHLRPTKKSKKQKKCAVCSANDKLKTYEFQLFSMIKRKEPFQEMSNKGSWKPAEQELILKAILALGKAKNANADVLKDGEVHINIIETLKKEFKEVRKLWTYLDEQICAQDELDMCKIRLQLKAPLEENRRDKVSSILKSLTYNLENKLETIHYLDEHELAHQKIILCNEATRYMAMLEKNLGTRKYLETLYKQHYEDENPDPCPVCHSHLEQQWSILPCAHSYCLDCVQRLVEQRRIPPAIQCCVCRTVHEASKISCIIKTGEKSNDCEKAKIVGDYSSKVDSIVRLILELRSEEESVKMLVFSSWPSVLNYIKGALINNNVTVELGSSAGLEKQIERFKDPKLNTTVLLLPINLGGKGLNLIEATHVILTEPLLNPGDELQAVGRVHRIGQIRPTVVHKFFIKNTIEESIQKAVSTHSQNWEKSKVTVGQLLNLYIEVSEEPENVTSQSQ